MIGFFKDGNWEPDEELQNQWDLGSGNFTVHQTIKFIVAELDRFCVMAGLFGVGVTSLIRKFGVGRPSFHWIGQAVDIRFWDWDQHFRRFVDRLLIAWRSIVPQIQWQWEATHLHIEFDNGDKRIKGS